MTREERKYLNELLDHCHDTGVQTIFMLVAFFVLLITVGILSK